VKKTKTKTKTKTKKPTIAEQVDSGKIKERCCGCKNLVPAKDGEMLNDGLFKCNSCIDEEG